MQYLNITQMKKRFSMRLPNRFFGLSQHFGENKLDYTQFGLKAHNGVDLTFNVGERIDAVCDGKVYNTQTDAENGGYGNTVYQITDFMFEDGIEFYFVIVYAHLQSFKVKKFQKIKEGQQIGRGDSTGFSTGQHIHLGIRPNFKQSNGVFKSMYDNGFRGYVDPFPFFKEELPFGYYKNWIKIDSANSNYRDKNEGELPVDLRYWKKRPWHAYLSEKKVLWQLGKKGLVAGKDFTDRELRAFVYGAWSYEEVFGNTGIAQTKTWMYRKKY